MEQGTPETKQPQQERGNKTLAFIVFLGLLIILAWLTIMGVRHLPGAFSSLASIVDSIQPGRTPSFATTPQESTVNHNQTTTLRWTGVPNRGSYALRYECVPGVSLEALSNTEGTQALECDTFYNLGSATSVSVMFRSTVSRFVDVPYTVAFIPDRDSETRIETDAVITVVNPALAVRDADEDSAPATEPDDEIEVDTPPTPPEDSIETERPDAGPSQPPTHTAPAPQYTYVEVPIYSVPVSDPGGFTDLKVSFMGLGTLDSSNQFIPLATMNRGETGAIRFSVQNIGTRTSETWSFRAVLPSGRVYESGPQTVLKPNERSTITLGFRAPETAGRYDFSVETTTVRDRNTANSGFNWALQVR